MIDLATPFQLILAQKMLTALGKVPGFREVCFEPKYALSGVRELPSQHTSQLPWHGTLTVVHDIPHGDAQPLFYRLATPPGPRQILADIALQDWLGQPLIGLQRDTDWNPDTVVRLAKSCGYSPKRWFSYNRRDVALACRSGEGVVFLDGFRTTPEEGLCVIREDEVVSWFGQLTPERRETNRALYKAFLFGEFGWLAAAARGDAEAMSTLCFGSAATGCVAPAKQSSKGYCVPKSLEMIMRFHGNTKHGEEYLRNEFGLTSSSTGISAADLTRIPAILKKATEKDKKPLTALLIEAKDWNLERAKAELKLDEPRPFLAFCGNHARVGAGYGFFEEDSKKVEGLICADPYGNWGCWESIDAGDFAVAILPA